MQNKLMIHSNNDYTLLLSPNIAGKRAN